MAFGSLDDSPYIPINSPITPIINAIRDAITAINARTNQAQVNIENQVANRSQGILNNLGQSTQSILNSVSNVLNQTLNRINASETNLRANQAAETARIQNAISNAASNVITNANGNTANINATNRNLLQGVQDTINHNLFELTGGLQSSIIGSINTLQGHVDNITSGLDGIVSDIGSTIANVIHGIITALENLFAPFIQWLANEGKEFGESVERQRSHMEHQLKAFIEGFQHIVEKVKNGSYRSYDQLEQDLRGINVDLGVISQIVDLAAIVPLIILISTAGFKTFTTQLQHIINIDNPTALLNPPDVIKLMYLGIANPALLRIELQRYGLSNERIDLAVEANRPMLAVGELSQSYLRGLINEDTHDHKLRQLGFRDTDISLLKRLYYIIPPINDIIRMSVREVFSDSIAQTYGLYEDYPENLTPFALQQGLSEDWSKRYWAAHWELPSPQMAFEMFHRGIITEDQTETLLRALDIMPYWRNKLIQMNYNLLTRVDVRRMYGTGVLTEQEVYAEYKKQGYSDTDARRLTNFTIRYETANDDTTDAQIKQLTRSVVERAYVRGVLTESEAITRLRELGYNENDAELLLSIAAYDNQTSGSLDRTQEILKRVANAALDGYRRRTLSREEAKDLLTDAGYTDAESDTLLDIGDVEYNVALKKEISDSIKQMFIERTIDNTEAFEVLTSNGFSGNEANRLLDGLSILRSLGTRKLTLAELTRAYRGNLLTDMQYYEELLGLGYNQRYADMLFAMNVK